MKKSKGIIFISFIVFFLIACDMVSETNDNLKKEEVIENSQESFTELNSLQQKTNISLIYDLEERQDKEEIILESKMIYDEHKNINSIYTQNETRKKDQIQLFDFYKDTDGMFADQGNGWIEFTGGESYASTYEPILNSFLDTVDEMEMSETDTGYEFNYTGQNGNVFRQVGEPYNISYQGLTDDEIELDLYFFIEKESMLIQKSKIGTQAVLDENSGVIINAETSFSNFNGFDNLEKPSGLEI